MIENVAATVYRALLVKNARLVCAESCTAGLLSSTLGSIPGISKVFWGAYIAYQTRAKTEILGIPPALLEQFGPVSREIVAAMVEGALQNSSADIAIAITGVAGPEPDEKNNPVGTVWIGCGSRNQRKWERNYFFSGDRTDIQKSAALAALQLLSDFLRTC
ncbi:MAG: CinA family protein [Termitinemataceae bacterium]